jgi:hypothetical protein
VEVAVVNNASAHDDEYVGQKEIGQELFLRLVETESAKELKPAVVTQSSVHVSDHYTGFRRQTID